MAAVLFSNCAYLGRFADKIFQRLKHLVAESFIPGRYKINDTVIEKSNFRFAQINQNRIIANGEFIIKHIEFRCTCSRCFSQSDFLSKFCSPLNMVNQYFQFIINDHYVLF